MTKFQKFQTYCGLFLPILGSLIVFFATMLELLRKKAAPKYWAYYFLIFLGFGLLATLVPKFLMSSETALLRFLQFFVTSLILLGANIACVALQRKCPGEAVSEREKYIVLLWITVAVFAVLLVIGTVTLPLWTVEYEDLNGPADTSLNTITLDEVVKDISFRSVKSYSSHKGRHSQVQSGFEDYDWDECTLAGEKANGVTVLQATKTNSNHLTLTIQSQLKAGNAEIFIIIDREIVRRIPAAMPDGKLLTLEYDNIAGKNIQVKLAAESAEFEITVSRYIS